MLYTIIQHAHSGWRWVVLILLVWAIVSAFGKWRSGATFTETDRKRAFFAMTATHLQLLFGLVLYFISPYVKFADDTMKDPLLRFYTVEHIFIMALAIFVISGGYRRSLGRATDTAKFKTQFYYFLIGLLLILAGIPWPFREGLSGAWF
ncbi:MAG: cytochrome B [Saprospirales bacterium]|nr:cytochrome B [Saprospirales bacterium]MBK7335142.1 cytochrome B [Saprospirales bacterium]